MARTANYARFTPKTRDKALYGMTSTTLVTDPWSFLSQATINSGKVDNWEVLKKTNTDMYTPTRNYHPATKKYVDDRVSKMGGGNMSKEIYDINDNGIVDNSERLGGMPKRYFASQEEVDNKSGITVMYPEMDAIGVDVLSFKITDKAVNNRYDGVRTSDSMGLRIVSPDFKSIIGRTEIPELDATGTYGSAKLGEYDSFPAARVQLVDPPTGEPIDDVDIVTSAQWVYFKDGETFQEKLDAGRLMGVAGISDVPGPQGPRGEKGDTGDVGPRGEKGDKGDRGDTGPASTIAGPRGMTGLKGDKGEQGVPGFISKTYTSIEDMESDAGFKVGTYAMLVNADANGDVYFKESSEVYSFVANIVGPRGLQGVQGDKGDKGDKGDIGPQGPRGLKGDAGQGYDVAVIRGTLPMPNAEGVIELDFPANYNRMNCVVSGCMVFTSGSSKGHAIGDTLQVYFESDKIYVKLAPAVVGEYTTYRLVLHNVGEGNE